MGDNLKVVILAGGIGSRLQEQTVVKPKPMVEVGEKPIIWHIMKIYGSYAFNEFIIALGYKGELIKRYFLDYHQLNHDFTIHTKDGHVAISGGKYEDWIVHLVDTGYETSTGGRIKRLKKWIGNRTFMMTYGDGVSNVNIKEVLEFHRRHKKFATVTAVRPEARFGGLAIKDGIVTQFTEKPQVEAGWINGGFFVFEPKVLDYIDGDDTVFERKPLERLTRDGQLVAYQHNGFWQPMDTMKDVNTLNDLWANGNAPWKVW